tara:strand:+ start:775 stop:1212 length:438 start_codon:yes stop_codon:yes gene_type:complete
MNENSTMDEDDRLSVVGSDNRPQVSQTVERFNKHLTNSEIAYINRIYHTNNDIKRETIMDLKLSEIMNNTANFFNDFLNEYSNKIYDTQLVYSSTHKSKDDVVENLRIYIIAFVRYVTESDNIIYFGIILIIISIILYFVSIINS